MPYAIENIADGTLVRRFGALPSAFEVEIEGHMRRIVAPVQVGDEGLGYRFVEIVEVNFAKPTAAFDYHQGADVVTRNGNVITVTRSWTAWTQQEIDAELASRRNAAAAAIFTDIDSDLRVALWLVRDEFTLLAGKFNALLDAIDNASNIATLKTAALAITNMPTRNAAQIEAAFRSKQGQIDNA